MRPPLLAASTDGRAAETPGMWQSAQLPSKKDRNNALKSTGPRTPCLLPQKPGHTVPRARLKNFQRRHGKTRSPASERPAPAFPYLPSCICRPASAFLHLPSRICRPAPASRFKRPLPGPATALHALRHLTGRTGQDRQKPRRNRGLPCWSAVFILHSGWMACLARQASGEIPPVPGCPAGPAGMPSGASGSLR